MGPGTNLVILHLPAYEDGTECSETSAYKIQAPGNYPEESIQHSEEGESFQSRTIILPIVLYECETWSLALREERRLRAFENRVLMRIFGPKMDEVKGSGENYIVRNL